MTKQMALEFTNMSMEHNTKVNGKMISNMVGALKHGQMSQSTMVTMLSVGNMVWVPTSGMMGPNISATGKRTRSRETASTLG
jgi:hypothetical protein